MDINYFPSFKGIPGAAAALHAALLHVAGADRDCWEQASRQMNMLEAADDR